MRFLVLLIAVCACHLAYGHAGIGPDIVSNTNTNVLDVNGGIIRRSFLLYRAGAMNDSVDGAASIDTSDNAAVIPKTSKKSKLKKNNKKHSKKQKIKVVTRPLDEREKQAIINKQSRIDMVLQVLSSVFYMLGSHLIFKLDFENRIIRRNSRFIFVFYILLSQLLYKYVLTRIESLDDQTEISDAKGIPSMNNALKMFGLGDKIGGNAAGVADQQQNKMTVKEFDIMELKKLSNGLIFEILSVTYMHMITKVGKPLLFVPLMGMMNKFKSPVVQIHLFRFHAIGNLERPFKSQIEKMMSGMAAKASDASASIASKEGDNDDSNDDNPLVTEISDEIKELDK